MGLQLDGTDDYISIPDNALWTDDSMSVFLWVKAATPVSTTHIFSHYETTGNQRAWATVNNNTDGKFRVVISTDGTFTTGVTVKDYKAAETLGDNSWHHVGFTWDVGTLLLYFDGIDVTAGATKTSDPAITSMHNSPANLSIGAYGTGFASLAGSVFDARIYNRVLSASEIETLYKSRIARSNPITNGLVGHWPLDDLAPGGNMGSATFVDRSGNGNNGTGSDSGASGGQGLASDFLTGP